ncbi:GLPGLI family protein [Pedobacter frigoris]|uniref:GLPGLI family protein n=1 Tax=Pedobacter frigoris TaxID=2571272 RepID=A0A4U1CIF8_9SPHI|nr:GLPGLI family protein [Pedobacter frigoris]TKC06241.1 GLPGLI family protein [Pedobacter frigoris]
MKKSLIIFSLCVFSAAVSGQEQKKGKVIDQASLRCYYLFSKKNEGEAKPYRKDTMVLEVGSVASRFYNPARLTRDSLVNAKMKNIDPSSIKSITVFKADAGKDLTGMPGTAASSSIEGESYQIIKDRSAKKVTVADYVSVMRDKFQYVDEIGALPWKISKETDTVASYTCQKATLNFRGRDYVAWFTEDVPVNDGPWKFGGLPGLILKIEDTKGLFLFELIGLDQLSAPIPIGVDDSKSIKCTRAEFEKQKKNQGAGMQINFNAGAMIIAEMPGKFEYFPMELE